MSYGSSSVAGPRFSSGAVAVSHPPPTVSPAVREPVLGHQNVPPEERALNVAEVAEFLRIGRNAVYDLVGRNKIPHKKIGKHIRFSSLALVRWLGEWSTQSAREGQ